MSPALLQLLLAVLNNSGELARQAQNIAVLISRASAERREPSAAELDAIERDFADASSALVLAIKRARAEGR